MKNFLSILFSSISLFSMAQNHDPGTDVKVKSRYIIQTYHLPGGGVHIDTLGLNTYTATGKIIALNDYKNNKWASSIVSTFDAKGNATSMTSTTGTFMTEHSEYVLDNRGNIITVIAHSYGRRANNVLFEVAVDTTHQTFDKANNRILQTRRTFKTSWKYDAHNHLIEHTSYTPKGEVSTREVTTYMNDLPVSVITYGYDGKPFSFITKQYNDQKQLVSNVDSTYNLLSKTVYTYNPQGLKATEITDKTFQQKTTKTEVTYEYDAAGRLAKQSIHSNDRSVLFFPVYTYPLPPQAEFDMSDSYTYDQYGNRLEIITEVNGKPARELNFLMTYY